MKVNSSIYKGIQFIQVNTLPPDQKEKLLSTINRDLFIKILADGKLIGNCLQFKDYEFWFDNVYLPSTANPKVSKNPTSHQESTLVGVGMKDHNS